MPISHHLLNRTRHVYMPISRRINFLCGRVQFSGVILQSSSFARLVTPRRQCALQTKVSAARSTIRIWESQTLREKSSHCWLHINLGGVRTRSHFVARAPLKIHPARSQQCARSGDAGLCSRRLSIGNTTCYSAGGQLPLCGVQHQSTSLAT